MNKFFFPYVTDSCTDGLETKIGAIYSKLADEKSKEIFMYRLMYSFTYDYNYIEKMICSTGSGRKFKELLLQKNKYPIYIYGAGIRGVRLKRLFSRINFVAFLDKNKEGMQDGLPIYNLDYLDGLDDKYTIIISVSTKYMDIRTDLLERGVPGNNIIVLKEFDNEESQYMYFDNSILTPDDKKVFVDAGCFDGHDTIRYLGWCSNENAPVIAIEADEGNYNICKNTLSCYQNVILYNLGLSDEKAVRKFYSSSSISSRISEEGNSEIVIQPLDALKNNQEIGYVKMDIEGEEAKALLGARNIITQQKPNLAISIYHKREDIWNLPVLLLDMNPDYKFYLRHYTIGLTDTVLYAVQE